MLSVTVMARVMEQYDKAYTIELLQGLYDELLLIGLGINPANPDTILDLLKVIDKVKARILNGSVINRKDLENV